MSRRGTIWSEDAEHLPDAVTHLQTLLSAHTCSETELYSVHMSPQHPNLLWMPGSSTF